MFPAQGGVCKQHDFPEFVIHVRFVRDNSDKHAGGFCYFFEFYHDLSFEIIKHRSVVQTSARKKVISVRRVLFSSFGSKCVSCIVCSLVSREVEYLWSSFNNQNNS